MGWPLMRLGEVISQRKDFIEIAPDETYARCRVQTSARGIIPVSYTHLRAHETDS